MQFFGIEEVIKPIVQISSTLIEWPAGSNIRIGGQAYNVTSTLTLDTATDIDTGAIASNTIYYIYAVVVAGTVSLKYSLSDSVPAGYSAYRRIGALTTDDTSEILDAKKGLSFKKVQTKYLSGNVTASGIINGPTIFYDFNNLVVDKKYELFANTRVSTSASSVLVTEYRNGTDLIFTSKAYANNSASSDGMLRKFTATATTISVNPNASVSTVMVGDTTPDDSYMTLCQLPENGFDNVIETNEW